MKKIIFSLFKKIFFGRKFFQKFFSKLHLFSLYAQGYGRGANAAESGEVNILKFIEKHFKNEDNLIFIDCGANCGDYSQLIVETISNNKIIYALEPVFATYNIICNRFKDNKNVIPIQIGLGNQSENRIIYLNKINNKHSSLYKRNMDHWNKDLSLNIEEKIDIRKLDEFCNEKKIKKIDLLKIDTEGHEYHILSGAKNLIEKSFIHFIQFEFGVCNIDSKVFFKDFFHLLNNTYNIYRIIEHGFHRIDKYDERIEVFLTTNYVAVSKNWMFQNKIKKL